MRIQSAHRQRRDFGRTPRRTKLQIDTVRLPAVAGQFYPSEPDELGRVVGQMLAEVEASPAPATGAIVPHAGLVYSGACAARVFKRIQFAPIVVILAPNHTGMLGAGGGASAWIGEAFRTPVGDTAVASGFIEALSEACRLVAHDPAAHRREHAIEVELPFLKAVAPQSTIAPIVLAWDDWSRCRELATGLATVVREWPEPVCLVASSDMTHYESAESAEEKDRVALHHVERLDGAGLLDACHRRGITMCGRAPSATVLEAARLLGSERAEIVDYRHSGWVTGEDDHVVAYAGVVIP